jgi:LacI family transcriptional regulator
MAPEVNRKRRVTQADVARAAKVSQAMVSYVVNDTLEARSIPEETRQRVQQAIDDLAYVPNLIGRRLRLNKTLTVACIIPDITNPFYPEFQRGVQDELQRHHYDLVIYNTDGTVDAEKRYVDSMLQGHIDGIIGVFFHLRAPELRSLLEQEVPVVRLEAAPKSPGPLPLDNIFVDNKAAGRTVTEHLIELGHTRIAMLTSDQGPGALREAGFREALAAHRLPLTPALIVQGSFNEQGGYDAMRQLLGRDLPTTAVIGANDLMALGAMMAIRDSGLNVPGDISVVGFDDIAVARLMYPPLTTVAQAQRDIGRRAARLLVDRLEGRAEPSGRSVEMPFRLIRRQSSRSILS